MVEVEKKVHLEEGYIGFAHSTQTLICAVGRDTSYTELAFRNISVEDLSKIEGFIRSIKDGILANRSTHLSLDEDDGA